MIGKIPDLSWRCGFKTPLSSVGKKSLSDSGGQQFE
jgi:hypothetical protein